MIGNWVPPSEAIDASAGYGKTEALCMRLMAIFLTDHEAARRTVALTFTRAAAGEIYTRLLQLVASALKDDAELDKLRTKFRERVDDSGAFDQVDRADLLGLLERLIRDMGELSISTIDSFFYRLVRVFAVDLGLPGSVELDAAGGASASADELMRELFGRFAADEALRSACRESRFGNEQKLYFDSCRELLEKALRFRPRRGDIAFWGGPFLKVVPADKAELAEALRLCESRAWPDKYTSKLGPLLRACAAADSPGYHFDRAGLETLRAFLKVWDNFPAVKPAGFGTGWSFPEPYASAIRRLLANGRNILLCQCARRTAALRTLLDSYVELYDKRILRRGRIDFSDLPLLLAENSGISGARDEVVGEIQYRTNCRFRHFLIDEFQDTSRVQWQVLDPISSDSGEEDHSLFIVGDVKQAIYGWREGDSQLMGDVRELRGLGGKPLDRSFRYGQDICDALNHLFGRRADGASAVEEFISRLRAADGPVADSAYADIADRWSRVFMEHRPDMAATSPGEFKVLALAPVYAFPGSADAGGDEGFAAAAARLIFEQLDSLHCRDENGNAAVDFFHSRLSCGVLVRNRQNGIRLRDALIGLRPDLADSIVWEADERISGDPLVVSLIAFGVWLQHPAETLAAELVSMNQLMRDLKPATEEARLEWLTLIAERGIAGFLRQVLRRLDSRSISWDEPPAASWDPVENGSVDALLVLAEEFDAGGATRDFLRFRALAADAAKPPRAAAGKLRLLTIHHSKGLTFDVVFHPMFIPSRGGNWKTPEAGGMIAGGGTPDRPAWLLNAPREEGMTVHEIARAVMMHHADVCFEELCDLYVALTRARRGMYVYLPPLNQEKAAAYHPEWKKPRLDENGEIVPPARSRAPVRKDLAQAKGAYYLSDFVFEACFGDRPVDQPLRTEKNVSGDIRYLELVFGQPWTPELKLPPRPAPPLEAVFAPMPKPPRRATPSRIEGGKRLYFALPRPDGGELLGTRVHEFFERIGRWSEFVPPPDTPPEVLEHYRVCAANPALTELLDEECELWRERPFDVVLRDGEGNAALVTGCFDRVQIRRAADGGAEHACIIDYKSNQATAEDVPELCEHYRKQLESYRAALAALLGVTPNLIDCRIVFTRIGMIAEV